MLIVQLGGHNSLRQCHFVSAFSLCSQPGYAPFFSPGAFGCLFIINSATDVSLWSGSSVLFPGTWTLHKIILLKHPYQRSRVAGGNIGISCVERSTGCTYVNYSSCRLLHGTVQLIIFVIGVYIGKCNNNPLYHCMLELCRTGTKTLTSLPADNKDEKSLLFIAKTH